jgi:glucose-1-phosphate thymidylyltransferase
MKAVIPAAGIGTRLRPHTLNKPKALLPVAGRPILAHIVDDLAAAGIEQFVLIIGYHGKTVRDWFAAARPELDITYVEQERRLGLGHAVWTAHETVGDEPFFCILGDTILKADYGALLSSPESIIGVRAVDDPRRFGVVVMDGDRVTGFVEKPEVPPSNLAIVGAYLFREGGALFEALRRIIRADRRTRGEYQLTDGLQLMLEEGHVFRTLAVGDWYDCGRRDTWLDTNRVLLAADPRAAAAGSCHIDPTARVVDSRLGPHVSVGPGAVVERCEIADAVIGAGSVLRDCRLTHSLVGEQCRVDGVVGAINIGDYCELTAKEQR